MIYVFLLWYWLTFHIGDASSFCSLSDYGFILYFCSIRWNNAKWIPWKYNELKAERHLFPTQLTPEVFNDINRPLQAYVMYSWSMGKGGGLSAFFCFPFLLAFFFYLFLLFVLCSLCALLCTLCPCAAPCLLSSVLSAFVLSYLYPTFSANLYPSPVVVQVVVQLNQ